MMVHGKRKKKEIFGFGIKTEFQFCYISLEKSVTLSEQLGFPGGSDGKESACNARDLGSSPGSGRSPGGDHGHSRIPPWRIPWTEKPDGL